MAARYLGEILVAKGLITSEQLSAALDEQKLSGQFLGAILLRKRLISEQDLLESLAEQFDMPFMSMKDIEINWELVGQFHSTLIVEHSCFPVYSDEEYITFAIVNPLDVWLLDEAQRQAGSLRVKTILISQSDMSNFLRDYQKFIDNKMNDAFGG